MKRKNITDFTFGNSNNGGLATPMTNNLASRPTKKAVNFLHFRALGLVLLVLFVVSKTLLLETFPVLQFGKQKENETQKNHSHLLRQSGEGWQVVDFEHGIKENQISSNVNGRHLGQRQRKQHKSVFIPKSKTSM